MAALNSQNQEDLALSAGYEDDTPTPLGWKRKLVPHIGKGLIPERTDVIFIAPDGEEFKSKTQLQQFLKSNKVGPTMSEFIWRTDETPRRSSRLTSKIPIKVMKIKSPPKAASKRMHAAEVPLEESKAGKRWRTEKAEIPIEKPKLGKGKRTKKARKVVPIESKDEGRASTGSPPVSHTEDNKKRSMKDVKKTKGARARTKSVKANGGAQMRKKDKNVNEETMESISHAGNKEEPSKTDHSLGAELKGDKDDGTNDSTNVTTEILEGSEKVDGGDKTTESMLGSDSVAEVMEAQSETLESDEEGRALGDEANHHA